MMKKILFFMFVLSLTFLVVQECSPITGTYGFLDYINILFCNTKTYSLYGRTNWNIINLLYYLVVTVLGVYYISEKIYTYNKGFQAMTVLRYKNCDRYLISCQKRNIKQTLQYIGFIFINILFSLLIVDINALLKTSDLIGQPMHLILFHLCLYVFKILIVFNIIELWLTFLILRFKFELLILLFIVLTTILLFLDILLEFSFITLTLNISQSIYVVSYFIIYVISFLLIKKKYKAKEIW